nr:tyrosine-type recombinase/integrase [Solimicrobium silvestre]
MWGECGKHEPAIHHVDLDLRHTWASWLVQNGTPMYDLQEMGGWKPAEMVRRYAHLAPAQMAKHADVVGSLLYGTNTSQKQK